MAGGDFVLRRLAEQTDLTIVNVDLLTYAGNLENLKSLEGDERHVFVRADEQAEWEASPGA